MRDVRTPLGQHAACLVHCKLFYLHDSSSIMYRNERPCRTSNCSEHNLTSTIRRRYSGSCSASTEKKSSVLKRLGSAGRRVPGFAVPFPRRLIPCTKFLLYVLLQRLVVGVSASQTCCSSLAHQDHDSTVPPWLTRQTQQKVYTTV